jgi:very-short-patch-repair endonuclease
MSRELRQKSAAIANGQHGAVTRRQLIDTGYTRHQIAGRKSSGELVSNRYAVYTSSGAPWNWQRAVMEACLAADAVAFRRTAGRLSQLDGSSDERIELLAPFERHVRQDGLVVCRTRCLPASDVVVIDNIPVTAIPRTLIDLGSRVSPMQVECALEDVLRRRLTRIEDIITRTEALRKPGRRGPDVLWRILVRRGLVAPAGSTPELRLVHILEHRSMPSHVRQQEVLTRNGRYDIDIAYPDVRLGVEYDGSQHWTLIERMNDQKRARALLAAGWPLLRFAAADLWRPGAVRAEVREHIKIRARDLGVVVVD